MHASCATDPQDDDILSSQVLLQHLIPEGTSYIEFFLIAQVERNSQHEQSITQAIFAALLSSTIITIDR